MTVQFADRGGDERRWSTIYATPVVDDDGALQFVVSIFHDITERIQSERQLRMRATQQTAVAALGQRALAGVDVDALLQDAVAMLAETLDIELAKVLELLPAGDALVVRAGVGWNDGVVGHAVVPAGEHTQAGYTLSRRHPVAVEDLESETRFVGAPILHEHGVRSGLTVTIGFGGNAYGILGVHSRKLRQFSEDDAHFLESIANVIASSISRSRAEADLERQREWLRVTLSSIGDAVIATDIDGRISFMNPVATALTGWPESEAMGRRLDEIFTIVNETTRAAAPNPAHEVLERGVVVGLANHTVLIARDGSERPIDDSAAPIRSADGTLFGVVLVFHDVSHRRRTEAELKLSESRFRLLIEQSPLSIQVFSPDGSCIQANEAWEQLWQAHREQLAGYNILEDHQLEAKGLLPLIRRAFAGEPQSTPPVRYDPRDIGKEGRPRWVRAVVYPVFGAQGAVREVVLVLEDVTQRVVAEQRLQVQFDISRFLAVSADAAAHETLSTLGTHLGATFGALWLVDRERNVLRVGDVWTAPEAHAEAFIAETRTMEIHPGEGVPGRIWQERAPLYFAEIPESDEFPRQATASELGLGTGYGFPIILGDEVYGVLEFFANAAVEPREEVVETMDSVGRQIAQFVERRRAEQALRESEERYRTVAETASDAIVISDESARIIFANRAVDSIFGYGIDELVGTDLTRLIPEYRRAVSAEASSWIGVELPGVRRDGRIVPLEISFGQFIKDGRRFVTGIVRDITDRKEAERELKHAKEQAEAASAAKDQFLAVLSHELRTPLTPVLTLVQFLESGAEPVDDHRSIFTMIRRNIELEARLIDDLLDLTRITRGKLHLDIETVDAHALLRNVVDICREDIASRELELEIALDAKHHAVRADPARLQQVFWNLLQNAVKFTPEGGRIAVRSFNPQSNTLQVDVSDTGIGMEADQLGRIFNAFEQAEQSISRRFGGLGLGLAISRSIVEMHGGEISAVSAGAHQGSTFSVKLTTAGSSDTPAIASAAKAELSTNGAPKRILLVDDHADTSNVMKLLLERRGYEVETAFDVAGALALAHSREYDLLISDIGLPDGSGLDLMRSIREFKALAGIALSGFGMEEDIRRSHDAGFSEHLIKPVNFQVLQEAIRRVLG
jgi:PAS domain S-box-containing protein